MAAVFTNKDHLIDRLTELAISGQWVFRGYNTQEQLLPNVIRRNVSDVEDTLLFEFERYGAQYINASNPVDFMSYAQHFGLSTRLLDFTYNPFVALYFALFHRNQMATTEILKIKIITIFDMHQLTIIS